MQDFFYVRKNGRYEQVRYADLIFVKAMRGYMKLVTEGHVYFVLNTIEEVEKFLPRRLFCRTHRSYIVAIDRIRSFDQTRLYLHAPASDKAESCSLCKTHELPVGKSFRRNIRESVQIIPNRAGQKSKAIREAEFVLEYGLEEE